ncbi:YibE/F family protein [Aestuariimicrobium soli]|uniref:YibE/F family protein n=1 Tax=Aestuariimicrobium soli TaxID=2035834 RepID=UPI003EC151B8
MAGHHHGESDEPLTDAQRSHRRSALTYLLAALIPLAIATVIGLVVLWPDDVSSHVNTAGIQEVLPGTTTHVGTITATRQVACEGQAGSVPGVESACVEVQVTVNDGPDTGHQESFTLTNAHLRSGVSVGDKVSLYRIPLEGSNPPQVAYSFRDFERTLPLTVFAIAFAVVVIAVARLRGLLSILGLGFAFVIIARFMLPALIEGRDPLLVGIVGSAAIMFVVLYFAHGFTLRTTTALVGTLFGLLLTAVLGWVGVRWAHLTGISGEDDYVLSASSPELLLTSVVICAVIVAAMGALNDVTITQASAVWELADTVTDRRRLFRSAMRIGRDHIASTVYTIAFASAGAALPVLLLLTILERPLPEVLTSEIFAAELLRTTIASIGLVLAVPVTTAVGVAAVSLGRRPPPDEATSGLGDGSGDDADDRTTDPGDARYRRPDTVPPDTAPLEEPA